MKKSPIMVSAALAVGLSLVLAGCTPPEQHSYSTKEVSDGTTSFTVVTNPADGKTLSMSKDSGFELIEKTGGENTFAFKDMNGNEKLDGWEDWRKTPAERAADLAPELTTEQIAGLMLFSPSERAPGDGLTDVQRKYLGDDNLRLILSAGTNAVEPNVQWSNEVQAFVESQASAETPYIPANFSTDPRSDATGGYSGSATADISQWPGNLGLAATFDPEVTRKFAELAGQEYRALGITNILGPQVDVASDPRWSRNNGTFGEDPELSAAMTAAYVEGFQTSTDGDGVPISTTIKHFAGDAAGEGGRVSYYDSGKFAVFPGNSYEQHLKPFLGSLDAMGAMVTYSIVVDGTGAPLHGDELVGGAFSKELIDILRVENDYQGVIMTDWGVTAGEGDDWYTNWGTEDLTVEERHFRVLASGNDMFGGNTEVAPVLAAHDLWQKAFEAGDLEIDADARFVQSAERILNVIFSSGLYENPFLDLEESKKVAGSKDKFAAGFEAQKHSVVVLKNKEEAIAYGSQLKDWSDKTVYIPSTYGYARAGILGRGEERETTLSLDAEAAEEYFAKVVTDTEVLDDKGNVVGFTAPDLSDVDLVLVGMENPDTEFAGYNSETGEYLPISLQYRPYTADSDSVRKASIAGNVLPDGSKENRSYYGKTAKTINEGDLDALERAVAAVRDSGADIPVITAMKAQRPLVPSEFEAASDAIVVGFDISDAALIEVALGLHDGPSGRLPMTFPANMETVEASLEDVSGDTEPYVDSAGNAYEFGFGLDADGKPIK